MTRVVRALLLWGWGCADTLVAPRPDGGAPPDGEAPSRMATESFVQAGRFADVLFVIDDSASMAEEQALLASAFPRFVDLIGEQGIDYHAGVISTNMGTGPYAWPESGCATGDGDEGRLLGEPRVVTPDLPDPADVLARNALLGTAGCGFERAIDAALRAISQDAAAGPNAGFLRDEALLALVFVTDEDDCSGDDRLYDPDDATVGPPTSYRCFDHGVACEGKAGGKLVGCEAVPGGGLAMGIDEALAALGAARGSTVTAALLGGATAPVRVGTDDLGYPEVEPSCTGAGTEARPPIRLAALVEGLGGVRASICTDELAPAFGEIVADLGDRLRSFCLGRDLAETVDPDCVVVEQREDGVVAIPPRGASTPGWWFARPIRLGCPHGAIFFDEPVVPRPGSRVEITCAFRESE